MYKTAALFVVTALVPAAFAQAPAYVLDVRAVEIRGPLSEGFRESLRGEPTSDSKTIAFTEADGLVGSVRVLMQGERLELNEGRGSPDVTILTDARITLALQTEAPGPLPIAEGSTFGAGGSGGGGGVAGDPRKRLEADLVGVEPDTVKAAADFIAAHWPAGDAAAVPWYAPVLVPQGFSTQLPYFEHERGDQYRLRKTEPVALGTLMGVAVAPQNDGLLKADLLYRRKTVLARPTVEGTQLEVGYPKWDYLYARFHAAAEPGHWVGYRLTKEDAPERQRFLFVRVNPGPAPVAPAQCSCEAQVFLVPKESAQRLDDAIVPWTDGERVFGDAVAFREMKADGRTVPVDEAFDTWLSKLGAQLRTGPRVTTQMGTIRDELWLRGRNYIPFPCKNGGPAEKLEQGIQLLWLFDPRIEEIRNSVDSYLAVVLDASMERDKAGVSTISRGYAVTLAVGNPEADNRLPVDFAFFERQPALAPTGLRALFGGKPTEPGPENAFRFRLKPPAGTWTGFTHPIGTNGDRTVILLRLALVAGPRLWAQATFSPEPDGGTTSAGLKVVLPAQPSGGR